MRMRMGEGNIMGLRDERETTQKGGTGSQREKEYGRGEGVGSRERKEDLFIVVCVANIIIIL